MYASHRQLLKYAEEVRHRRNVISEQYSSAKVGHSPLSVNHSLLILASLAVRCRKGETDRGRC